ncbi:hypothetical protein EWM64_g9481 [Hericium alpestre]|uniref:Uncharacterized protein n=1 Tax=Hericium alpestre TaxID=135208 RepID=A0A4Y9ZK23_9AGAM|nr:hypothetical protein EWM64_g9481 [Hericium alpestre]
MEFRYIVQSPLIDDHMVNRLSECLAEFHQKKQIILDCGARRGKNKAIDNWHIPKLELMQNVAPSIKQMGAPMQWNADRTECSHITFVKEPFRSSNHCNFDPQICRALDRAEKCYLFHITTSICSSATSATDNTSDDGDMDDMIEEGSGSDAEDKDENMTGLFADLNNTC